MEPLSRTTLLLARISVGLLGINALLGALVLVGIPYVWACREAWLALDTAQVYVDTGDGVAATRAAERLLKAWRVVFWTTVVLLVGTIGIVAALTVVGLAFEHATGDM